MRCEAQPASWFTVVSAVFGPVGRLPRMGDHMGEDPTENKGGLNKFVSPFAVTRALGWVVMGMLPQSWLQYPYSELPSMPLPRCFTSCTPEKRGTWEGAEVGMCKEGRQGTDAFGRVTREAGKICIMGKESGLEIVEREDFSWSWSDLDHPLVPSALGSLEALEDQPFSTPVGQHGFPQQVPAPQRPETRTV
jgi:hypothetical protein